VPGSEVGVRGSPPKAAIDGRRRGGVADTLAAGAAGDGGVTGSRGAQLEFAPALPPAAVLDTCNRSKPASSIGVDGSLPITALPPRANAAWDHLSPANAFAAREDAVLWRRTLCRVSRLCTDALRLAARWSASDFKQARESFAACHMREQ